MASWKEAEDDREELLKRGEPCARDGWTMEDDDLYAARIKAQLAKLVALESKEVRELNEALKAVEVRDPLRTLMNPRLLFVDDLTGGIELSIRVDTIDRDTGAAMHLLQSRFPIPRNNGRWIERYGSDSALLAAWVRSCLRRVMEHEVDESIWTGGKRAFEPEHEGA